MVNKVVLHATVFAGTIGVLTGFSFSTYSQGRVTPSIACDGPNMNNVKGLTFQFRSAVLASAGVGNGPSMLRLTLAIKNSTDIPIGVFFFQPETTASTDTGLRLQAEQASGMSLCSNARGWCTTNGTITTIGANATTNPILFLEGVGPFDEGIKRQLSEARSVDFAAVVYAVVGSEKGFLPVSCVDMPLRNMFAH